MSIELTILLSVISVSTAVVFGLKRNRREEKADDQKEAVNMVSQAENTEMAGYFRVCDRACIFTDPVHVLSVC